MSETYPELNPENALIFRITHIDNMPFILRNGLHCRNSRNDYGFTQIGDRNLIEHRKTQGIPVAPGGTLADYIPFYFTPFSMMGYKMYTGHEPDKVRKVPNEEIVILVASLPTLADSDIPFVFSDRHASCDEPEFFTTPDDLDKIDWDILQRKDFKGNPKDKEKTDRYQAEALVHKHLPIDRLKSIVCQGAAQKERLEQERGAANLNPPIKAGSTWYFP